MSSFNTRLQRGGMVLAGCLALFALIGFFWTPYDPAAMAINERLNAPTALHPFGTDHFGRDILSMLMAGAYTTLAVAALAVLIGVVIGVPLGLAGSARKGRMPDEAILRFNDLVFAFPALLTAILITARFGPGAVNAMIAIGIFNIPVFARISRAAALPLWQQDFILSARLAGKGDARIALEHILPNIVPLLLVQIAIQFSIAILAEAGLAYIGLGVQPPQPSWGRMLADGQTMVAIAPHVVYAPGLAIVLSVLSLNTLAEVMKQRFGLMGGRG
jgi:peptide/nickel transport system permease protein|tara:strand:+ start:4508 stop:5329 length:822 start_codon:yes stop_codon:yes gene_type:complete